MTGNDVTGTGTDWKCEGHVISGGKPLTSGEKRIAGSGWGKPLTSGEKRIAGSGGNR